MSDEFGRVVVLGSLNLDRRLELERLPSPGETVAARDASTGPGGKGLNQAGAAARSGARVELVGCVGADDAGRELLALARRDGIGVDGVAVLEGEATGQAMVWVDDAGDNSIVVVAGANAGMEDRSDVAALVEGLELTHPDVVLAQGETSLAITTTVFAGARRRGARTVLNLAPYQAPHADLLAATSVLVVNETEFGLLVGSAQVVDGAHRVAAARAVLDEGPDVVVVTLGAAGAMAVAAGTEHVIDARSVGVVDSTGAGDGFVGVLAGELARAMDLDRALAYATAAASLVVQRPGAAASMPSRAEIDQEVARPISGP
ncbi:MAG: ribokinase [Acidimicrobiales bacterium]